MPETIDCRSEEGVTIGLIDSLISICRVLSKRDFGDAQVQEALKDFNADNDVRTVVLHGFIAKDK